jgi:hypothetical protein
MSDEDKRQLVHNIHQSANELSKLAQELDGHSRPVRVSPLARTGHCGVVRVDALGGKDMGPDYLDERHQGCRCRAHPIGERGYIDAFAPVTWLTISPVPVKDLRAGDFDGDGLTDIFYSLNRQWHIWYGRTCAWTPVESSVTPISEMLFGEFMQILHPGDQLWQCSRDPEHAKQSISLDVERDIDFVFDRLQCVG